MPAGSVKTERDEAAWARAKRAVHRQYDFSEENDRFWKLVQHIYGNMKSMESTDAMDEIDQDGDAALHRTGTRHMDKALVGLVSRPSLPRVLIAKSYIRAHTRTLRDGRTITVGAYFTKKVAKPDEEGKKGRAPRALKEAPSRGVHPGQTHEQLAHRLMRHVQEGTLTHDEAEANLAHLERRAHAGHHLEHGTGAAWTPEDTHQFIAHARGRLAEHKAGQERAAQQQRIEELTGKEGQEPGPPPARYQVKIGVERGSRRYHLVDTRTGEAVRHPTYGHIMAFQHKEDAQAWADREQTRQRQGQQPPPGKDRPPYGITGQERQAQWDAKMREQQQAERERQGEKPPPTRRGRGQRHRANIEALMQQRRAMGKSLVLGLVLGMSST